MQIDTVNGDLAGFSDLLGAPNPKSRSAKSRRRSPGNSTPGPAEAVGMEVEPKLSSLDFLLSMLQSDLGEIADAGGGVKLFNPPDRIIIVLQGIRLCRNHSILHSGQTCPMC